MPLANLKHFIVPQEGVFFELLVKQVETTNAAAQALYLMLRDYNQIEEKAKHIKQLEQEGDELLHELYAWLNKTFIVPFDHADISALATTLDDILDLTNAAARRLYVYEVRSPPESLANLASILAEQTRELKTAIESIRSQKSFAYAEVHCVEINRLENEADEEYTKAVALLFKRTDTLEILKLKEVFDSLESATDKVERAANVISDIVMKNT